MHITFSPMRSDAVVALHRTGEVLTINGEALDFSGLAEGEVLSRDMIPCDWIGADVHRTDGLVHVTVIVPHGPESNDSELYPAPLILTQDGPFGLAG